MPTIVTITNEPTTVIGGLNYDYSGQDRVLKNVHKNEYEVFYCGQNQGGLDHKLLSSVEDHDTFRIYYRNLTNTPYSYLGDTTISSVVQYRTVPLRQNSVPTERLQIHLVVRNVSNQIVPNTQYIGSGKYKKSVLSHSNFPTNQNTNLGFYKL